MRVIESSRDWHAELVERHRHVNLLHRHGHDVLRIEEAEGQPSDLRGAVHVRSSDRGVSGSRRVCISGGTARLTLRQTTEAALSRHLTANLSRT